ncbi:MAG: ethylbenzene dehydrogenase [Chloroflexi bacterium]|nr:ethylbenzene dehydrogenase [Chloroflexota bacterium]
MRQKVFFVVMSLVLMAMMAAMWLPQPTASATPLGQEVSALVSLAADESPVLDGVADEAAWADAEASDIEVFGGANNGTTTVTLRSVYTEDMVYFLVTWEDPTESFIRSPWEMQADGTWIQLKDPDDKGGDNNLWYEDKFAFIWPINNSIPGFEEAGCFMACHAGENNDVKPYGNKYTAEEGQTGDIWHWKSVRNLNQVHDQYLDSTQYSPDTKDAGRHSDPKDSGGYADNKTEDGKLPAFMPAGEDFPRDGSPGYILESETLPFDPAMFQSGDRLPAIVKSEFVGDGGDIAAGWMWEDGVWTLELGRSLVTESEYDVQFDDLSASYYFAVAAFDNAQVRHAFETGATQFTFGQ